MKVRTRYAPSPTGFMHIGNLRTAIFEYLLAKKYNGDFILRIEDTDQEREVEGAIDFIYNTLDLCGFKIDEGPNNEGNFGPYIQSKRKDIYKEYALKLVEMGKAYYCFCSEEELTKMREKADARKKPFLYDGRCSRLSKEKIEENLKNNVPYVIRQKMPKEGVTIVEDLIYGKVKIDNSILDDQILLKSDEFPTYNFANVIDDHLMEITHVIRGKEYLDQTAKYNLLYEAFGWEKPTYIHVAMVLGEDGNKLSKRNGDASFMDLYNEGYLPEAIVNYLSLLGWSPETNQEVFSMEELISNFNEERISKKLSDYLKNSDDFLDNFSKEFGVSKEDIISFFEDDSYTSEEDYKMVINLYTNGFLNNFVSTKIEFIEKDEKIVNFEFNKNSIKISDDDMLVFTIKEDEKDKYSINLKYELDGMNVELSGTATMSYAQMSTPFVSNSVSLEELTEEDFVTFGENLSKNEAFINIIEKYVGPIENIQL